MWGALQRFRKENTQVLSKIDGQKSEPMVSKAKLDLKVYFDLLILGEALLPVLLFWIEKYVVPLIFFISWFWELKVPILIGNEIHKIVHVVFLMTIMKPHPGNPFKKEVLQCSSVTWTCLVIESKFSQTILSQR